MIISEIKQTVGYISLSDCAKLNALSAEMDDEIVTCLKDFEVFQTGILMSVNQQFYKTHLPIQNREKITPSKSSALNSPVISLHATCASRRCSANSSI